MCLAKVSGKEARRFCKSILGAMTTDCCEEEAKTGEEEGEETAKVVEAGVPLVLLCEPSCRTIEAMFGQPEVSSKLFDRLHKDYFKGKLSKIGQHPTANFALQKMLAACDDKDEVGTESEFN